MTGRNLPCSRVWISFLVHLDHLADKADVDHFDGAVVILYLLEHLLAEEQVAVLAGEADRPAAMLIEVADDLLVHLAGQHHLDDRHGRFVSHPHAADKLGDDAVALEGFVDLRAAAMDDDHVDAEGAEQDDVKGERLLERLIGHGMAAVLDDDGLAGKTPDVRQRLHQGVCLVDKLPAYAMSCKAEISSESEQL